MSKLTQEYDNLNEQRKKIIDELKSLGESEMVKRYLELEKQNKNLYNQQINLYEVMIEGKNTSCEHILLYFKQEYNNLNEQRKKIIDELKSLGESETVKRYLELEKQNKDLYNQQMNLYKAMIEEKFASCEHILLYSKIDYDRYGGHTYKSCGCIKCGLTNSVLDGDYSCVEEGIMYNYLRKHRLSGTQTETVCDLDLAKAIYSKIKQAHPDIDDGTAIKYFEIALDNIRNIKVSDDRKVSRAKRLSLNPNFKRWNSFDV